jgi:Asp-tRNA(Asn)/Glu-tRNA(Gln) amidotransferase A subunit family amidase
MRFEECRRYDAVAFAGLLNNGELSADELLDVVTAHAEAVNPKINAIVHKQYERARATVNKTPLRDVGRAAMRWARPPRARMLTRGRTRLPRPVHRPWVGSSPGQPSAMASQTHSA